MTAPSCTPDCSPGGMYHSASCPVAHPGEEARLRQELEAAQKHAHGTCDCANHLECDTALQDGIAKALRA